MSDNISNFDHMTRSSYFSHHQEVLNPIQYANWLMASRVRSFIECLAEETPSAATLTSLLHGSVCAGMLIICRNCS